MIQAEWERLADRFPTAQLAMYVVMPNHLHGIITIVGAALVGAPNADALGVRATTRVAPTGGAERQATLGAMVGAFKSLTTNRYARGVREREWPSFDGRLWQRNYYEHDPQPARSRRRPPVHPRQARPLGRRSEHPEQHQTEKIDTMATESTTHSRIVQRLWDYCSVLRGDGVSYGDYVEQLTYLLFLKMADEQVREFAGQSAIEP